MRLTCPNCSSACQFEHALIPTREQELERSDCAHAWCESAALDRVHGPGARP